MSLATVYTLLVIVTHSENGHLACGIVPPHKVPMIKLAPSKVHPWEPVSVLGVLIEHGSGVTGRCMGDHKVPALESLHPTRMMASP